MVPDHQVTDPPEEDPQGKAGRGEIDHGPESEVVLPDVGNGGQNRARDASEERDSALPHLEDPKGVVERVGDLGEVSDHIGEAGSDHRSKERPEQCVPDVILRRAPGALAPFDHVLGSDQEPERDPDPMGADGEGAEVDAREDLPLQGVPSELDGRGEVHGQERPNSTKQAWVSGMRSANNRSTAFAYIRISYCAASAFLRDRKFMRERALSVQ